MNTTNEKYHGWTNYETWVVNLWLANEYADYSTILDWIDDGEYIKGNRDDAIVMADSLNDWINLRCPMAYDEASMFSDMMRASLQSVNWIEIAQHWIDDYGKDPAPDLDPVKLLLWGMVY